MTKSTSPFDAETATARSPRRSKKPQQRSAPVKRHASRQANASPAKPSAVRGRKPSAVALWFLMIWHGALSGGFFVAMMTGEGAYNAHVFAGVVVIIAIGFRLLVGTAAPKGHVLSFPMPNLKTMIQGSHGFRRFLNHTVGLAMFLFCALASLTGWYVKGSTDVHGAVAYMALALICGHVVLVILLQGWKKIEARVQAKT